MKKVLSIIILFSFTLFAQIPGGFPQPGKGELSGGFGINWIDENPYYTFHFTPEISLFNFGFGLDLNLEFSPDGELREENFNDVSDFISIIRYVRYGVKNDPIFAKVGEIDHYTLGNGNMILNYANSPSFDHRKTGLALDIDFEKYGFESIYSDISGGGLLGFRGFVRPLQLTPAGDIPILGNLEFGLSFAGDFHDNAHILDGYYSALDSQFVITREDNNLIAYSADITFPLLDNKLVGIDLYSNYTTFGEYGSGASAGLLFNFSGLGLLSATLKFERRFNNDEYIPSYFGALYEIERFQASTSPTARFQSKARRLDTTVAKGNGFYGLLGVDVAGIFQIIGSYERLDEHPQSGRLHLETDLSPQEGSFVLRAAYDKIDIADEEDLFTLDERSLLSAELGYKPIPFLVVSVVFLQTYTPVRDADDEILKYEPQKRVEPRLSFVYPLDFGMGGK